jgi:hypothetical protein
MSTWRFEEPFHWTEAERREIEALVARGAIRIVNATADNRLVYEVMDPSVVEFGGTK